MSETKKKLVIGLFALQMVWVIVLTVFLVRERRQEVEIYLPETYYVASGITQEIYNSQITNLGTYITDYEVLWECEKGENLARKFRIDTEGVDLGEYELKVSVFSRDGKLLAKKKSTLSIVEAKQDPISILALGDSLSSNSSLYWKLLEHTGGNLICNGTRYSEWFLTEGRQGFSAEDYLTETPFTLTDQPETCHPFYNPKTKTFDWNYYKSTTGVNPEAVWVFLGTNGLYDGDENAKNIVKIVRKIRRADSNIPIFVANTTYCADQNGIGSWKTSDGTVLLAGDSKQERDRLTFALMTKLGQKLKRMDRVYLVPLAISMDSATVYETEAREASPHSKQEELYAVDPLHPTKAGYYQMADVFYSYFCGTMEEWK